MADETGSVGIFTGLGAAAAAFVITAWRQLTASARKKEKARIIVLEGRVTELETQNSFLISNMETVIGDVKKTKMRLAALSRQHKKQFAEMEGQTNTLDKILTTLEQLTRQQAP